MKKIYLKPSAEVVLLNVRQHLLDISGGYGGSATKPAKSRGGASWDDDDDDEIGDAGTRKKVSQWDD